METLNEYIKSGREHLAKVEYDGKSKIVTVRTYEGDPNRVREVCISAFELYLTSVIVLF